jgi:hypothetical protein
MHRIFWSVNVMRRDFLRDLGIDGKMTLKLTARKYDVRSCIELNLLRTESYVRRGVANLRVYFRVPKSVNFFTSRSAAQEGTLPLGVTIDMDGLLLIICGETSQGPDDYPIARSIGFTSE